MVLDILNSTYVYPNFHLEKLPIAFRNLTYPFELDGDLVWPESLRESEETYVTTLAEHEIAEVEAALDHFKSMKKCFNLQH